MLLLPSRYIAAVQGHKEALKDLNILKRTLTQEEMDSWDAMAAEAQIERINNPEAMDIYDSNASLRMSNFSDPSHPKLNILSQPLDRQKCN